jgi:hypothetical protein
VPPRSSIVKKLAVGTTVSGSSVGNSFPASPKARYSPRCVADRAVEARPMKRARLPFLKYPVYGVLAVMLQVPARQMPFGCRSFLKRGKRSLRSESVRREAASSRSSRNEKKLESVTATWGSRAYGSESTSLQTSSKLDPR